MLQYDKLYSFEANGQDFQKIPELTKKFKE